MLKYLLDSIINIIFESKFAEFLSILLTVLLQIYIFKKVSKFNTTREEGVFLEIILSLCDFESFFCERKKKQKLKN